MRGMSPGTGLAIGGCRVQFDRLLKLRWLLGEQDLPYIPAPKNWEDTPHLKPLLKNCVFAIPTAGKQLSEKGRGWGTI